MNTLIGHNVFVRTVTHHHTGRLIAIHDNGFIELADAAWIADSGRWANALKNGSLNEVEPFPGTCFVAIGAIIDVCKWNHDLPRKQK